MCHGCLTTLSLTNVEKVSFPHDRDTCVVFQPIPSTRITIYPKRRRLVADNNEDRKRRGERKREKIGKKSSRRQSPWGRKTREKIDSGIRRETLLPPSSLPFLSSLWLNNDPPSPPLRLPVNRDPLPSPAGELVSRAFCTRNFALGGGNVHDLYQHPRNFSRWIDKQQQWAMGNFRGWRSTFNYRENFESAKILLLLRQLLVEVEVTLRGTLCEEKFSREDEEGLRRQIFPPNFYRGSASNRRIFRKEWFISR